MPVRPCLTCGALSPESYCPKHRRSTFNPARRSGWAAGRWRARVLAQTGGRCAVPGCRTPYDRVQAHHMHALADGGAGEAPGVALCHRHHVEATRREARARRN